MELYHKLFRESISAILIVSDNNEIIDINEAAYDLFGKSKKSIKKENIKWIIDLLNKHKDSGPIQDTIRYNNKSGSQQTLLYNISSINVDKQSFRSICFTKVSDQIVASPSASSIPLQNESMIKLNGNGHMALKNIPTVEEDLIIASEERYKTLVEQASDAFIINDPKGFILEANQAATILLGYSKEEYITLNVRDLISPDELKEKPIKEEELKNGLITKTERNLIHKNGNIVPGYITSKMLSDGRVMVIARDMGEWIRARKLVQESEAQLKEAQKLARIGSWTLDFESGKLQWSDEAYSIFELNHNQDYKSVDAFINRIHPDDREYVKSNFDKSLNEKIKYDIIYRIIGENENIKFVNEKCEIYFDNNGIANRCSATIQDITERKKIEDALKFNETQLELIYNATSAIIYLIEVDNDRFKFISANNAGLKASGLKPEQFFNKYIEQIIPSASLEFVEDKYRKAIKERRTVTWEEESKYPSGKKTWIISITPVFGNDNVCSRLVGTVQDITEVKSVSERILKEKDLSDSIIKNLPGIFFLFNQQGKFLRWNKNFEEFSVYSRSEIAEKSPLDFVEEEDKVRINEVINKVFTQGHGEIEANMLNRNGEMIPMYFSGWAANFEGEPCLIGMAIDISKRKIAENELRQSERKFNSLVNTIDGIVWEADAATLQYSFVSMQAEKLLGYPINEWIDNKTFLEDHIYIEDKELTLKYLKKLGEGEKSRLLEYRLKTATGKFIWLEDLVAIIDDNNTKVLRGVMTDITERKKKELELQESHAKYMAIIDNSMNAFLLTNEEGDIIDTNQTAREMFGYTVEELSKLKTWEIFDNSYPKYLEGVELRRRTGKGKGEVYGLKKNGEKFPLAFTSSVFINAEGKQMISAIGIDISDRIKYEESLLKSNERFEKVSEATFDAIWDWDVKSHELYLGEGFKELFGYDIKNTKCEFSTWADNIHPDDKDQIVLSRLNKIIQYDQNKWMDEYRYLRADGSVAYVLDKGILLRENGFTYRMIGAMQDVTNSKIAEAALLKSNERFQYVSRATFDAIWDWDLNTDELYWGDGFEQLFGYKLENNKGKINTWYDHIHKDDLDRVITKINAAIKSDSINWKDDYRYMKADNSYAYVADKGIIIRNEEGAPYRMIGAMRDITERKIDEEKLNQLNKELQYNAEQLSISNAELESFAYVTSHDLQEPLRMVSSFLQLLQKKYENVLDEKGMKYINFAIDGSERMKILIQDLLEFSRINSSKEVYSQVDLNEISNKTLSNLSTLIEETEATINIPLLPIIYGNESQFLQLFQNLIGNALKYRSQRPPVINVTYNENSDCWHFSIEDNGIGIDEKFYNKIFVIFQRLHNRKEYDGTGIGLAVCKKIVDFHGGKIWLESKPGMGSIFHFTISKNLT